MKWICLLLPACVSMLVINKRKGEQEASKNVLVDIWRWGVWVLINNLLTFFTLLYVVGYDSLLMEVFESFSFSMKYTLLALIYAWIIPYMVEIVKKYISITFTIKEK